MLKEKQLDVLAKEVFIMHVGLSGEQIILIFFSLQKNTKEIHFLKKNPSAFTLLIFQAFSGNL